MLQAMKQKTTPAAVVVKSSPRDSPSGPTTGKHPPLLLWLSAGREHPLPGGMEGTALLCG